MSIKINGQTFGIKRTRYAIEMRDKENNILFLLDEYGNIVKVGDITEVGEIQSAGNITIKDGEPTLTLYDTGDDSEVGFVYETATGLKFDLTDKDAIFSTTGNVSVKGTGPSCDFEVNGYYGHKVQEVDATTATISASTVSVVHTATAAVTLTLPSAASLWNSTDEIGGEITICDSGVNSLTNAITVNRAGSDTITDDTTGNTSVSINANGDTLTLRVISSTTFMVV